MTERDLFAAVTDPERLTRDGFPVLAGIAELVGAGNDAAAADLLIRIREHAHVLRATRPVLDALLRQVGLLPYLDETEVGVADALALELHRPAGMEDVVLHSVQAAAYRRLVDGDDLVLMAPTSFGKSLLIDALIAADHLKRVMILVPSIALIDETRARLQRRFGSRRRLVTHASQAIDDNCLIVMTQERALELTRGRSLGLDLLVVDEFYKLDPSMDPERSELLNTAFDRLRRTARQVFLLGPNVGGLTPRLPPDFRPAVIATDIRTTALDVTRVDVPAADRLDELVRILQSNDGPTLIYCRAPAGCRRVAEHLLSAGIVRPAPDMAETARWLRRHVHAEWQLPKFLEAGIGVHHARMPRWLGQHVVRAFDGGSLDVLICTSTLIEGVNTAARNVVIFENRIGDHSLDLFSFNNIAGRSGRMWRHFVGRVFHFHPRPRGPLPEVDVPVLTQSEGAAPGLLLEVPADERTPQAEERLHALLNQELLSVETLRANAGIAPERQLAVAAILDEDPEFFEGDLDWSRMPTGAQLAAACRLIVDYQMGFVGKHHGIASARQLAARIDRFRADPDIAGLIADELSRDFAADVDEAVESVMQFTRSWAQFEFPKQLRALERIGREVLGRAGCEVGELSQFATAAERLFLPPNIQMLDEYGVPPQLALRLFPEGNVDLDALLDALRGIAPSTVALDPFEEQLLSSVRSRL